MCLKNKNKSLDCPIYWIGLLKYIRIKSKNENLDVQYIRHFYSDTLKLYQNICTLFLCPIYWIIKLLPIFYLKFYVKKI